MEGELLSLKWNNHRTTFLHVIGTLRSKASYTDATIACEGKFYPVHKLVLSTCSEYFGAIFERTPCKSPVVVLKDIECKNLEFLLDYMYVGEVNVRQNELAALIKAAECLRIKGLAVPDEDPSNSNYSTGYSPKGRSDSQRESSPPAKRRRNLQSNSEEKRIENQSVDDVLGLESASSKDNDASTDDTPIKLEPLEANDISDFIPNSNVSADDRVTDDGGGAVDGEREDSTSELKDYFKVNIEKEEPVHLSEYSSSDFPGPSGVQNSTLSHWDSENSFQSEHLALGSTTSQQDSQQQQQLHELCVSPCQVKKCYVRLAALKPGTGAQKKPKKKRGRPKKLRLSRPMLHSLSKQSVSTNKDSEHEIPVEIKMEPTVECDVGESVLMPSELEETVANIKVEDEDSSDKQMYHCQFCPYMCSSRSYIIRHEEKHIEIPSSFSCPQCNFITDRKQSLTFHIKSNHLEKKPFACSKCTFRTGSKHSLASHFHYTHSETGTQKKYKCSMCTYSSNRPYNLKSHQRCRHQAERSFKCSHCNYRSFLPATLKKHEIRMHAEKNLFLCEICNYRFSTLVHLNGHKARKHGVNKVFKCKKCPFEAPSAPELKEHKRVEHGRALKINKVYSIKQNRVYSLRENRITKYE